VLTRFALALCAMTFLLAVNAPAHADWRVVQWFYGDCKIWFDKGIPPFGGGWRSLTGPFQTTAQRDMCFSGSTTAVFVVSEPTFATASTP